MTTPGPGVLDAHPYDSGSNAPAARGRTWWPGANDLAAMVGLVESAESESNRPVVVDDTESSTVIAARLSQLFK